MKNRSVRPIAIASLCMTMLFSTVPAEAATAEDYDRAANYLTEIGYTEQEEKGKTLTYGDLEEMVTAAATRDEELGKRTDTVFDGINPNETVTRQELAFALYLCAGSPKAEEECPFTDVDEDAAEAVSYLYEEKAMSGLTSIRFNPKGNATKMGAEYAVYKLFHKNPPYDAGYGVVKYHESEVTVAEGTKTAYDITVDELLDSAKNFVQLAASSGYTYGHSTTNPPCADGLSSCDRVVARALWDIGFTDQPRGGISIYTMEGYLLPRGWAMSNNRYDIKPGSIVLVGSGSEVQHAFLVISYDPETGTGTKYDHGSTSQIRTSGPQTFSGTGPQTWGHGTRNLIAVFNLPSVGIGG